MFIYRSFVLLSFFPGTMTRSIDRFDILPDVGVFSRPQQFIDLRVWYFCSGLLVYFQNTRGEVKDNYFGSLLLNSLLRRLCVFQLLRSDLPRLIVDQARKVLCREIFKDLKQTNGLFPIYFKKSLLSLMSMSILPKCRALQHITVEKRW